MVTLRTYEVSSMCMRLISSRSAEASLKRSCEAADSMPVSSRSNALSTRASSGCRSSRSPFSELHRSCTKSTSGQEYIDDTRCKSAPHTENGTSKDVLQTAPCAASTKLNLLCKGRGQTEPGVCRCASPQDVSARHTTAVVAARKDATCETSPAGLQGAAAAHRRQRKAPARARTKTRDR